MGLFAIMQVKLGNSRGLFCYDAEMFDLSEVVFRLYYSFINIRPFRGRELQPLLFDTTLTTISHGYAQLHREGIQILAMSNIYDESNLDILPTSNMSNIYSVSNTNMLPTSERSNNYC